MTRRSRMRLLDSELTVIFTLCQVVESDVLMGHLAHAREMTDKLREATEAARRFIGDARHMLPELTEQFNQRLRQIDKRVAQLNASIAPAPANCASHDSSKLAQIWKAS
jgi:ABC-type transporter Mla subunit MlaD